MTIKACLSVIAGYTAIALLPTQAEASDCGFFLSKIRDLERFCASGQYCSDLRSFKEVAQQEGCVVPGGSSQPRTVFPSPRPEMPRSQGSTGQARTPPKFPPKREVASQSCGDIPSEYSSYQAVVALTLSAKIRALREGVEDLKAQKAELEKDYRWQIGDAGSTRENVTYLAMVTKTITDLIEGLAGFSTESKAVGRVLRAGGFRTTTKQVYDNIKTGQKVDGLIKKDSEEILFDFVLDKAADMNPVVRGVAAAKDLAENATEIYKAPLRLAEARSEYHRAIANIDRQMENLVRKVEDAEVRMVSEGADKLLKRWMEVRSICYKDQPKGPTLQRD